MRRFKGHSLTASRASVATLAFLASNSSVNTLDIFAPSGGKNACQNTCWGASPNPAGCGPVLTLRALTLGQNVPKFKRTTEAIADGTGESYKQIQRYIRLTELIPELLDLVDNKKLQFTVAVDISYIDKEVQEWIYEYISDTGFIKPKQIAALRNQLNNGPINQIQMLSIFNNCVMAKKVSRSLTFSEKKLTKYFPDDYTAKDMEQVIESLLEKWMQEQSC